MYGFGSGQLWGIDNTTNPTPPRFGGLQECSVDFAMGQKELYGERQFPVAVARTTGKISCKAKWAQLQGRALNALFFNSSKAAGQNGVASGEAGTITAGAITVANGADFSLDLGVRYAATGLPLVRVASGPASGQYAVNTTTGAYTFNVSENDTAVKIDYMYDIASTGDTVTISNLLIGVAPTFKAVLTQLYDNKRNTLTLNANISSKLTVGTKLEDFTQPEFDFGSFADASDTVGTWSFAEAS
jgi:hypothetical protein